MRPTCGPDARGSTRSRCIRRASSTLRAIRARRLPCRALPSDTAVERFARLAGVSPPAARLRRQPAAHRPRHRRRRRLRGRSPHWPAASSCPRAYRISEADRWAGLAQIPRSREYLRSLDAAIGFALTDRGLKTRGYFPADARPQQRKRNPTYAADPYALAAESAARAGTYAAGGPAPRPAREPAPDDRIALHDARVRAPARRDSGSRRTERQGSPCCGSRCRWPRRQIRWMAKCGSDAAATFAPARRREPRRPSRRPGRRAARPSRLLAPHAHRRHADSRRRHRPGDHRGHRAPARRGGRRHRVGPPARRHGRGRTRPAIRSPTPRSSRSSAPSWR